MTLTLADVRTYGRTTATLQPTPDQTGRLAHARFLQTIRPLATEPPITIDLLPRTVNVNWYEGDDIFIDLVLTTEGGDPAELALATAQSQLRVTPNDDVVLAEFDATVTGNVVHLHLPHAQNVHMPDAAVWDVQLTFASQEYGDIIYTIVAGRIGITQEVTRP